jgi:hypothetical protein
MLTDALHHTGVSTEVDGSLLEGMVAWVVEGTEFIETIVRPVNP